MNIFENPIVLQYIVTFAVALFLAVAAAGVNQLRAYLKAKAGVEGSNYAFELVRRLVLAAEQYAATKTGQEQMAWVLDNALTLLPQHGIKGIDIGTLRQFAEAAYRQEISLFPDLKAFTTPSQPAPVESPKPTAPAA